MEEPPLDVDTSTCASCWSFAKVETTSVQGGGRRRGLLMGKDYMAGPWPWSENAELG